MEQKKNNPGVDSNRYAQLISDRAAEAVWHRFVLFSLKKGVCVFAQQISTGKKRTWFQSLHIKVNSKCIIEEYVGENF